MKKTTFLYYFFILIIYSSYSQSGKITYKIFVQSDDSNISEDSKKLYLDLVTIANNQSFILQFNNFKSSFCILNKLTVKDEKLIKLENASKSAFTSKNEIYLDRLNKTLISKTTDNVMILESYDDSNWEITKETKMIDQYTCFKALKKINYKTRNGDTNYRIVTAWFTPSINIPLGPKIFFGLPGLILELVDKRTTYIAEKIELNTTDIEIKFPEGKTISREEYDNKLKKQMGM